MSITATVPQAAGNITAAFVALSLGVPEARVVDLALTLDAASTAPGGATSAGGRRQRQLQATDAAPSPAEPTASILVMCFVLAPVNGSAGPATEDVYGILTQSSAAWIESPSVSRVPGSGPILMAQLVR